MTELKNSDLSDRLDEVLFRANMACIRAVKLKKLVLEQGRYIKNIHDQASNEKIKLINTRDDFYFDQYLMRKFIEKHSQNFVARRLEMDVKNEKMNC